MYEGTIGEIRMFAGTFAPQDWMLCAGQLLPIEQYTALYSVIGVNYGGNGMNNFALPDLRGRVPVGAGQGIGLTPINVGQFIGTERDNPVQVQAASGTEVTAESSQIKDNHQPSLGINYVICINGNYPSRP